MQRRRKKNLICTWHWDPLDIDWLQDLGLVGGLDCGEGEV